MFKIRKVPQLGPSRDSVWSSFAAENGGQYSEGSDASSMQRLLDHHPNPSRIVFNKDGVEMKIDAFVSSRGGARNTYVRFSFEFPTEQNEILVIYRKELWRIFTSLFHRPNSSGNQKLDREFTFFTSDLRRARMVLSDQRVSGFLLSDPSIILNLGTIRKVYVPPKPKGSLFLLDRVGDIRKKEKLNQYVDFCFYFVALFQGAK